MHGERRGRRVDLVVGELQGVDVDEQRAVPVAGGEGRRRRPHRAPQLVHPAQALGRVEHRPRVGERSLGRPHQRLVAEDVPVRRAHDGLVGHPHAVQGLAERRLEPGQVAGQRALAAEVGKGLALEARDVVQPRRLLDGLGQGGGGHRLDEVAQRPLLHGLDRGLGAGVAGHEDHRDVQVPGADGPQELEAVEPRHVDVGQDGVEGAAGQDLQGRRPVSGRLHRPAGVTQDLAPHLEQGALVIHEEQAALLARAARGHLGYGSRAGRDLLLRHQVSAGLPIHLIATALLYCNPRACEPGSARDGTLYARPRKTYPVAADRST